MNQTTHINAISQQDLFGRAVAARLSAGTDELPHEISERLRAARVRALSVRQNLQAQTAWAVSRTGAAQGALHFDQERPGFWQRVAAALPLIMLAAGLVAINVVQNDRRANEVAEVDAALLSGDLPPSAYADPGFAQFLKLGR